MFTVGLFTNAYCGLKPARATGLARASHARGSVGGYLHALVNARLGARGSGLPVNPRGTVLPLNPRGTVLPGNPRGLIFPVTAWGTVLPLNQWGITVLPLNPRGTVLPLNPRGTGLPVIARLRARGSGLPVDAPASGWRHAAVAGGAAGRRAGSRALSAMCPPCATL